MSADSAPHDDLVTVINPSEAQAQVNTLGTSYWKTGGRCNDVGSKLSDGGSDLTL